MKTRKTVVVALALNALFYAALIRVLGVNRLSMLLLSIGVLITVFSAICYLAEETYFFQRAARRIERAVRRMAKN